MIAYFDCFSGISGDMTLGAFIDLGVPVKFLQDSLAEIPLTGFDLTVSDVSRSGIVAKSVQVHTSNNKTSRTFSEIVSLIQKSPLSQEVRKKSIDIFDRIADAEAIIHGCHKDDVHFHEVGGIDAIVDIVGSALCVNYLGIKKIVSSKIPLGKGFTSCRHGTLPVPVPATLDILKGVPVYGTDIPHELVTPTGAAIIASLAESYEALPEMIVEKTGYGAGRRELASIPNLLRIVIGTASNGQIGHLSEYQQDAIVVLETCVDDMNPEVFGFLMERLFESDAIDVYWIPVFMKKNRPGTKIQVLCRESRKNDLIHCLLLQTSAIGVRYYDTKRILLPREKINITSAYGEIQAKRVIEPGGSVRIVPEYEVCKKIALEKNIPIRVVYDTIIKSL